MGFRIFFMHFIKFSQKIFRCTTTCFGKFEVVELIPMIGLSIFLIFTFSY